MTFFVKSGIPRTCPAHHEVDYLITSTWPATGTPLYYAEDMLGSSRVIVKSNGTLCGVYPERSRRNADFTPFGAEATATSTCAQNYKFEGKERDSESGNDDFGARYYSWRFGRWLSADWSSVPVAVPYANLTNPQTLNLYSMVADDPESFADLDGHLIETPLTQLEAELFSPEPSDSSSNSAPAQNATGPRKQEPKTGVPKKVVRTGKHVYKKPTTKNGRKFEGTVYRYKVVDAKNNIVRGPMTVTENLTATPQTKDIPTAGTWNTTNGQFEDYVGYVEPPGGFPKNYLNVVDQNFIVAQGGVSTLLDTTIQQTVSSDPNGNVTGVAHTIEQ